MEEAQGGCEMIKTEAAVQETAGGPLQFGWKINTTGGSCGADHNDAQRNYDDRFPQ